MLCVYIVEGMYVVVNDMLSLMSVMSTMYPIEKIQCSFSKHINGFRNDYNYLNSTLFKGGDIYITHNLYMENK